MTRKKRTQQNPLNPAQNGSQIQKIKDQKGLGQPQKEKEEACQGPCQGPCQGQGQGKGQERKQGQEREQEQGQKRKDTKNEKTVCNHHPSLKPDQPQQQSRQQPRQNGEKSFAKKIDEIFKGDKNAEKNQSFVKNQKNQKPQDDVTEEKEEKKEKKENEENEENDERTKGDGEDDDISEWKANIQKKIREKAQRELIRRERRKNRKRKKRKAAAEARRQKGQPSAQPSTPPAGVEEWVAGAWSELAMKETGSRWKPMGPLGDGAYAHVYRVTDLLLNQNPKRHWASLGGTTVALKVQRVPRDDWSWTLREIDILMRAQTHPHIVRVLGVGFGGHSLRMRLMTMPRAATTLEDILRKLPFHSRLNMYIEVRRQMLCALSHLEKHRICHRDLKPANILLDWRFPDQPFSIPPPRRLRRIRLGPDSRPLGDTDGGLYRPALCGADGKSEWNPERDQSDGGRRPFCLCLCDFGLAARYSPEAWRTVGTFCPVPRKRRSSDASDLESVDSSFTDFEDSGDEDDGEKNGKEQNDFDVHEENFGADDQDMVRVADRVVIHDRGRIFRKKKKGFRNNNDDDDEKTDDAFSDLSDIVCSDAEDDDEDEDDDGTDSEDMDDNPETHKIIKKDKEEKIDPEKAQRALRACLPFLNNRKKEEKGSQNSDDDDVENVGDSEDDSENFPKEFSKEFSKDFSEEKEKDSEEDSDEVSYDSESEDDSDDEDDEDEEQKDEKDEKDENGENGEKEKEKEKENGKNKNDKGKGPITRLTEGMCTLYYRAPETLGRRRRYGSRVDLWSLGITLLDFLRGRCIWRVEIAHEDQLAVLLESVTGCPASIIMGRPPRRYLVEEAASQGRGCDDEVKTKDNEEDEDDEDEDEENEKEKRKVSKKKTESDKEKDDESEEEEEEDDEEREQREREDEKQRFGPPQSWFGVIRSMRKSWTKKKKYTRLVSDLTSSLEPMLTLDPGQRPSASLLLKSAGKPKFTSRCQYHKCFANQNGNYSDNATKDTEKTKVLKVEKGKEKGKEMENVEKVWTSLTKLKKCAKTQNIGLPIEKQASDEIGQRSPKLNSSDEEILKKHPRILPEKLADAYRWIDEVCSRQNDASAGPGAREVLGRFLTWCEPNMRPGKLPRTALACAWLTMQYRTRDGVAPEMILDVARPSRIKSRAGVLRRTAAKVLRTLDWRLDVDPPDPSDLDYCLHGVSSSLTPDSVFQ